MEEIEREIENCEALWTEEKESQVLETLLVNPNDTTYQKNRRYYYIKSNFKLINLAGVNKVGRIKDDKLIATKTDVLQIVKDLHEFYGHKGEKKTYKQIAELYSNIPMSVIRSFISQCAGCTRKTTKKVVNSAVPKPITVNELLQEGQVILEESQSFPDGKCKSVLNLFFFLTCSFLLPNSIVPEILT